MREEQDNTNFAGEREVTAGIDTVTMSHRKNAEQASNGILDFYPPLGVRPLSVWVTGITVY